MNLVKRQHYIPRMLLKRFADDNGKIYMLNDEGKVICTSLESAAVQKHLYSVFSEIGDKDDSVEKRFAKIEGQADQVLNRVLSSRDSIVAEDFIKIIEFVVWMMFRSPKIVQTAEEMGKSDEMKRDIKLTAIKKGYPLRTAHNYINEIEENKGLTYSQVISHLFKDRYQKIIQNFDGYLYFSKETDFMVSDTYSVFDAYKNIDLSGEPMEWWNLTVQVFCPLSSRHCMVFLPKEVSDKSGENYINFYRYEVESDIAERINFISSLQKDRFIYASSEDILKNI